jgi:hypothetical protein
LIWKVVASHLEDIDSHILFPVGWCESNGYQLKPPRKAVARRNTLKKQIAMVQPEIKPATFSTSVMDMYTADDFRSDTYTQFKNGDAGGKGGGRTQTQTQINIGDAGCVGGGRKQTRKRS